jgi:hypothetical protein
MILIWAEIEEGCGWRVIPRSSVYLATFLGSGSCQESKDSCMYVCMADIDLVCFFMPPAMQRAQLWPVDGQFLWLDRAKLATHNQ